MIMFYGVVVFMVIVGMLWMTNYKKSERHKQLWLPLIAVVFSLAVLHLDFIFSNELVEYLFETYPFLESYTVLFYNLFLLLVFFVIKYVWKLVDKITSFFHRLLSGGKAKVQKNSWFVKLIHSLPESIRTKLIVKKGEDHTVALAYQQGIHDITLKPEWFFPRKMFLLLSIIPAIMVSLYILSVSFDLTWLILFLPTYPALSLLLLLECAWFLGGDRPQFRKGSMTGRDAISTTKAQYKELYEMYQETWPERIAAHGQLQSLSSLESHVPTIHGEEEEDAQFKAICKQLRIKGVTLRSSHTDVLQQILNDQDVLIEDPVYDEWGHYLFPAIDNLLVKNKKILVIVKDYQAAKIGVDWIHKGLQKETGLEFLWNITTLEEAIENNIDTDVLVVTPENLSQKSFYDFIQHLNGTAQFEAVVMIEAERVLSEHSTLLHTFVLRLQDQQQQKAQFIIMSQWYEGLEVAFKKITKANTENTVVTLPRSKDFYYIIWKKEGNERFHSKIFPKLTHRIIEPEVVLSVIPLKNDIANIHFLYQDKNPVYESVDELIGNKEHLLEFGVPSILLDSMKQKYHFHKHYWEVPMSKHALLIVRDSNYNLVDTLTQWWSNGTQDLFVQVVSPPYLLRDYLASTISYYLGNNRKISPMAPRLTQSRWGVAYFLLERMSQGYISEEEINGILTRAGVHETTVINGLNVFFQQCFSSQEDYRHAIEVRKERLFLSKKNQFKDKVTYKISSRLKEVLLEGWSQFFDIKNQTGTVVSQLLEGHLYQNYLVGQLHAFDGQLYRIRNVDKTVKTIDVVFENLTEKRLYRQNRKYHLHGSWPEVHAKDKYFTQYQMQSAIVEVPYVVSTSGYYTFNEGIAFNEGLSTYTKLPPHERKEVLRTYSNGKVMKLTFRHKNRETIEEQQSISFTLAFLLNEAFYTLFPHSYMYLAVTTQLDGDFFDGNDEQAQHMRRIFPNLVTSFEAPSKREVSIYIFEDSPLQLGLLESIQENWSHVLEIVDDYIAWVLENKEQHGEYLRFGKEEIGGLFALEETGQLIQAVLPNSSLRTVRQNIVEMEPLNTIDQEDVEKKQCDFCARHYRATEFEQLDDGRDRCLHCKKSAINYVSELPVLEKQIRHYFSEELQVQLRRHIHIEFLNSRAIHELSGIPFIPTPQYDPRIVGKASIDDKKNITVYLENGAPRIQALTTLAHEFVHVWQFDNLNVHYMTIEELEGLASWVEVHFVKMLGEREYAEFLHQQLMKRQDEYGEGYRQMVQRLERSSQLETPFDLYREKKIFI